MTTKKEQRSQTEGQIVAALVDIGQQKPLSTISVSDIIRHCGLNRGTFYLHFLDKDDLVLHIRESLLNQIRQILHAEMTHTMDIRYLHERKPYPVIIKVARWMLDHQRLLNFWLGPHGDAQFYPRLQQIVQKAIDQELLDTKGSETFKNGFTNKYALTIITNNLLTILTLWLKEDTHDLSVDDVAKMVMETLYQSPYQLLDLPHQQEK